MRMDQIKQALAPCGLSCEKCFAHVDGEIRQYAMKLRDALGNFGPYAKRFETLMANPMFKNYPQFKGMLEYLANGNCRGCRIEQCKMFENCGIRVCYQTKQVDFCYQCQDFPCDNTRFDPVLHQAWVQINESIRRKGIEDYCLKTRNRPRYP